MCQSFTSIIPTIRTMLATLEVVPPTQHCKQLNHPWVTNCFLSSFHAKMSWCNPNSREIQATLFYCIQYTIMSLVHSKSICGGYNEETLTNTNEATHLNNIIMNMNIIIPTQSHISSYDPSSSTFFLSNNWCTKYLIITKARLMPYTYL
jgi:hypothetical protein